MTEYLQVIAKLEEQFAVKFTTLDLTSKTFLFTGDITGTHHEAVVKVDGEGRDAAVDCLVSDAMDIEFGVIDGRYVSSIEAKRRGLALFLDIVTVLAD